MTIDNPNWTIFSYLEHKYVEFVTPYSTAVWDYWLQNIYYLKQSAGGAWTVRGSSISGGSAGTAYSATPDGVDRWEGKTYAQASNGGGFIWLVLESPCGIQMCVMQQAGTSHVAIAQNKFESEGAWRNAGSVTATVRPADTTSATEQEREVSTDVYGTTIHKWDPVWNTRHNVHIIKKNDGKGFFIAETGSSSNWRLSGVFQASGGIAEDTGNWGIIVPGAPFVANFAFSPPESSTSARILMRSITATKRASIYYYTLTNYTPYASTFWGADPFEFSRNDGVLKYFATPLGIVHSSPTWHYRGVIPGLYRGFDNMGSSVDIDNGKMAKFGNFLIPWDVGDAGYFQTPVLSYT